MNKQQLVGAIAKDTKQSKAASEAALNSVLGNILKASKKESVQLVGFGTFRTIKTKARNGINPQTKKPIKIPAKKVIKFKVSKNIAY
ncbi:MAG: HU family DNA-binding protein [archaeon]